MEKNLTSLKFESKNIMGFADVILYAAILIFSYFSFQHADILHTGGSSFTYLNGHILDFYEANVKSFGGNNYLPSTYIIFAIWNIPIKLLRLVSEPPLNVGYVVFWYKLLTTLFYFASAYIIYRIGLVIGLTRANSKLMTAFWLSTPIAFFSQFIFGQYDILTTFFVLLGLLFYLKRNIKLFILFFAISMTFKYFPLFIFVPLLLMIEKTPRKLIINMFFFFVPIAIEVLFYFHSKAFISGVFGFSANDRLFTAGLKLEGGITISAFLIFWFLLCAFAYWKTIKDDKDLINWALYLSMVVTSLLFSLMLWHPQWLLFATPFLAITTFLHKRANFFILIDMVMMFFFIGFTVNFFTGNVDQSLWNLGIFGKFSDFTNDPNSVLAMKTFFIPHDVSIYFSFISACFLINIIFKIPVWWNSDSNSENINDLVITNHWNLVRSRFIIGVMIFIIPAVISFLAPNHGEQLYNLNSDSLGKAEPVGEITKGINVGQVFKANSKEIKMVKIQLATYSRINNSHLTFTLKEYNTGINENILFSKNITADELNDSEYFTIKFKSIPVLPGKYYSFNIESNDAIVGNAITIWHTPNANQLGDTFSTINGEKQNYNLHFMIYGKK